MRKIINPLSRSDFFNQLNGILSSVNWMARINDQLYDEPYVALSIQLDKQLNTIKAAYSDRFECVLYKTLLNDGWDAAKKRKKALKLENSFREGIREDETLNFDFAYDEYLKCCKNKLLSNTDTESSTQMEKIPKKDVSNNLSGIRKTLAHLKVKAKNDPDARELVVELNKQFALHIRYLDKIGGHHNYDDVELNN